MILKKIIAAFAIYCLPISARTQNNLFTSFDVQPGAGCSIFIQWSADPRSDTLDFVVERSADNMKWLKTDIETHKLSHKYSSFDNEPGHGYNYYRVRQAGHFDSLSVTSVKWVQLNRNHEIFIWPNPVQEVFYVKTPFFNGLIDVINSDGKLILSVAITGFITSVTTVPLAKGTYFLHIKNNNQDIAEKIIKE